MSGEELRAALERIDLGLYPASSPDGERTEWQSGWNAGVVAYGEAVDAALAAPSTPEPSGLPEAAQAYVDLLAGIKAARAAEPGGRREIATALLDAVKDDLDHRDGFHPGEPCAWHDHRDALRAAYNAVVEAAARAAPSTEPALDVADLRARITTNLNVYQRRVDNGTASDFDRGKAAGFRVVLAVLDDPHPTPTFSCARLAESQP